MNEATKTTVFVGVAAALLIGAEIAGPSAVPVATIPETGEFYKDFKDATLANSLEVVTFDGETGTPYQFKVVREGGVYRIPSHQNYPADAQQQLGAAAASLIGLEKLGKVSDDKNTHGLYGVVDPDPKTAKAGDKGLGKKVTIADKSDNKLAEFIIGDAVKGQAGLRYVRVPGQDAVYKVKVSPDKLSTKFEDWIEKDLLKLNSFDIKQVVFNNYSIDEANQRIVPGDLLDLTLKEEGGTSKWSLKDLAPGEQLEEQKLNDMKNAIDDLKIVDVRKKPAGIAANLKQAEGGGVNRAELIDLAKHGFVLVSDLGLRSNEGEVFCNMKDGVSYVLRFGEIAAATGDQMEKADPVEGNEVKPVAEAKKGANRYIFVTAQFDESLLPKPELKPLPELPAGAAGPADDKAAKPAEDKPAEAKADETKPAEGDDKTDSQKAKEEKEIDRQRKIVEKENKRLQDEYDDKVKKGQERVKELNDRFADWYYVISDDVYRKIHLGRVDIVKVVKKPEDDHSPEAFNKLKEEGIKASGSSPQF